jgi:glycosyltransferase involved in cell wall biosynthesis
MRGVVRLLTRLGVSRGTEIWPAGATAVDAHLGSADLRILICCERLAASQEVHLLRPLRRLRRLGNCGLIIVSEDALSAAGVASWLARAWAGLTPHAVILSRFAGPQTSDIISLAQASGVPVIAHLDDFLLEVPADLGADKVRRHNRPERVAALRRSLTDADLLYVSTPPLAARLRQEGFSRPMVISELQSCADPDEMSTPDQARPPGPVRIGYQGTRNHRLDLEIILPAVLRVLTARPETTFELFGTIETAPQLESLGDRFRRHPPVEDYDAFLGKLKELRWDLGVAPLRSTEFNSYRTYTKWTEYTIAGIPTVASDSVVYRDVTAGGAGILAAVETWAEVLLRAVDDAALRREMVSRAQQRVRNGLNLENMERQLLHVLETAGAAAAKRL